MFAILQIKDHISRNNKISMLNDLVEEMTSVRANIIPSPNPHSLQKFGGTVSDRDFQNNIYMMNTAVIEKMYNSKQDIIDELS
jgi:hypothetical protein